MKSQAMTTVGAVLKGIISGKSVKTLERPVSGTELGILKVSAVTWGEFRPYENKAMPPDYDPGDCPRAMDGDILISRANTRELVGAPVMVKGDHPHLLLSDKLLKLIPDESVISRRYLVLALRSPAAKQHFSQCAGGSSGSMTNITQSDIRSTPIPLPSLAEQRRIAAILDQADALRAKRREALAELDGLAQAIFVEMFGDAKHWPVKPLNDLTSDMLIGLVRSASEFGQNFETPYIRMNSIGRNGEFIANLVQRTDATADEIRRYRLNPGDMLFNTRNSEELVGKTTIFREEGIYIFNNNIMRIRFNSEVESDFVASVFLTQHIQQELQQRKSGTTSVFAIYGRDIKTLPIPVPPINLQRQFSTRKRAIEDLKKVHQQALTELDALFASLQHRAFRGEL